MRLYGRMMVCAGLVFVAAGAFSAEPTVSNVSAAQRYPWNGMVDVNFTVANAVAGKNKLTVALKDVVGGTNIVATSLTQGAVPVTNGVTSVVNGANSVQWDAQKDLPKGFTLNRAKAAVTVSPYTFAVKFNANGGMGTMANESFSYGTAKALTANAFTRSGYTFTGWAKTATGAVAYTNKQSVSNLSGTDAATVNLYAIWKSDNPLYMVIDLSGGTSATSYPISYLDAVPSGGWTDTYKTTKLVLRRCEAGKASTGKYTLTKPFYIGVFEMTGKQWSLVMGSSTSVNTKPIAGPSCYYTDIRGATNGVKWPSSSAVDSTSFIGRIRAKTGLADLDLPTEAQWEYACRAGTTTVYSYGDTASGNYMWYVSNTRNSGTDLYSSQVVGTKKPNSWGIYDMHGNVAEWCLDWYGSSAPSGNDPKGPSSWSGQQMEYRVVRGGCFFDSADECSSSKRSVRPQTYSVYLPGDDNLRWGFRLAMTIQ